MQSASSVSANLDLLTTLIMTLIKRRMLSKRTLVSRSPIVVVNDLDDCMAKCTLTKTY